MDRRPLARLLSDATGLPVAVDHDVRAAGAAEGAYGAAAGSRNVVFAAIGTGVAASLTSDGRAVEGAISGAASSVTSGGARRRALRVRSARLPRGVLLGRGPGRRYAASAPLIDGETPDAASVIARVDTDPVAARVWSEGLDALATGLATLTLLVDPEVIVLGGGVAQAGNAFLEPLRERLTAALAWREAPRLTTAALGTHAGRIGAAMLAFEAAQRPEVTRSWTACHPG